MKEYIVYVHKNKINNKVYIGQTSDSLERRSRGGSGYKSSPHFYHAIQEYGWENFEHFILESNLTSAQADIREKFWIKAFDSTNPDKGYNLTEGGKYAQTTGKAKTRKKVVCKETGQVFESLSEAAIWAGMKKTSTSNISAQIRGDKPSAGKHPVTGQPLHWYFEGQLLESKNKKKEKPGAKKVKNLDTGEIFDSINEAAKAYGISNVTISKSCKSGGIIATGKNNNAKWHWIFLN